MDTQEKRANINYYKWVCIGLIFLIAMIHAISAQVLVDFFPTNGTFQNFNPVRRFLAGQVPIRDFTLYLGFGHFILGTITTVLFGGNFAGSLSAFSLLSLLSMIVFAYILGRAILGTSNKAITVVLAAQLFFCSGLVVILDNEITKDIFDAITKCLYVGTSARMLRAMAPSFVIIGIVLGYKIYKNKEEKFYKKRYYWSAAYFGLLGGLAFIFSNDYGISTWICLLAVYSYIIAIKTKSFKKTISTVLIYLVANIISVIIAVSILTAGNLTEWLSQTFQTGGYQKWYYIGIKSYYIYNIDLSVLILLQEILCVFYAVMLFRKKAEIRACVRYGIPGFLNLTAYCAANEYRLISGSYIHEAAYTIFFLSVFCEIVSFILKRIPIKKIILKVCTGMLIILSVAYLFVDSWNTYNLFSDKTRGIYYSELGGYLDRFGEDVREAAEFLNGKKVFSTYSSALEVVTDQFHPTKYDYIIHAMGDEARKEYLEIFKEGNFDYVATQNGDFNFWEPWIRSANWYFYQELFDNYHPIYENTYEVFWERNEEGKTNKKKMNADVEIRKVSESRAIIYVRTDENINGFANLDIEYKTEKTNPLVIYTSLGCYDIFSNMYKSKEDTTNYNQFALRGSAKIRKETIPLYMKDGEGAIIIRANPEEDAKLMIGEIKCDSYYDIEY